MKHTVFSFGFYFQQNFSNPYILKSIKKYAWINSLRILKKCFDAVKQWLPTGVHAHYVPESIDNIPLIVTFWLATNLFNYGCYKIFKFLFHRSKKVDKQESILPNFDFFVFPIFAFKLGHFKVQITFSHATNTHA